MAGNPVGHEQIISIEGGTLKTAESQKIRERVFLYFSKQNTRRQKMFGDRKNQHNNLGKILFDQNVKSELQENLKVGKATYNKSYQGQSSQLLCLCQTVEVTLIKKKNKDKYLC